MTIHTACVAGLTIWCGSLLAQPWRPEKVVGMEYPRSALVANLEGTGAIECYIANDGSVIRAERISGHAELASAAIRNAMRWTFLRVNSGQGRYRLRYHFRIEAERKPSATFRFVMPDQIFVAADKFHHDGTGDAALQGARGAASATAPRTP